MTDVALHVELRCQDEMAVESALEEEAGGPMPLIARVFAKR